MKNTLVFLCLALSFAGRTQYYYEDIVGAKDLGERMKAYVVNKVRSVSATGYDASGGKSADFNEWQQVQPDVNSFNVTTRQGQDFTHQSYQFDQKFNLASILDTSGSIHSTTTYSYDKDQNITKIRTVVIDSLNDFTQTEAHEWTYEDSGRPLMMRRILNDKDTFEYRFTPDEKGNTGGEQLFRNGVGFDQVYYYYDEKGRLTDIVRYDRKARQLLPDYMFEYDEQNRVIQKITTLSAAGRNYIIWRYLFNEKGLKTKEALFNKQKELTGKIEYSFTFRQ